ncbi:MAG: extracellular solute-binding protein [Actinophytocola sp.]|uniref:extracellular solute-binding protein n=1 Tax=Actinophytocola sp. TaxID=1872138 RepID=UPI00132C541E|nr:extracellular solute-binding protein [Actinophytocola sp.]MPZ81903.1 extracellular solute-binding protein [Actinophytocola sp.]
MRRGTRFGVALAAVSALVASCGSPTSAGPASGEDAPASGTLIVNGAGTLARPFKAVIAAFTTRNPDVTVESRFAGSVEVVRGITELDMPVDVLGVADYSLIPEMMFGAGGGPRFADWYIGFVSNRITFAYTDQSNGAAELTTDNWREVMSRPGVRIGRSNPDTDPSGYQTLQMLALAQDYYDEPKLSAEVLANSPRETMVDTETHLLPALVSGQIDYLGIYRSDALQHDLRFIDLPPQIDLSDPAQADAYESASVPTASGTRTGKPIVYALTIPTNAPNTAAAQRFVEFVLSSDGQKIMSDNGFTVLDPAVAGGESLPTSLRPLAAPAALPGG